MEVNIEHMPVSLEHDGLKDAVVCVNYVSDYNVRYISQIFWRLLIVTMIIHLWKFLQKTKVLLMNHCHTKIQMTRY